MKKRILSLLCILIICGILSGCGGAASQDTFLSKLLATDELNIMDFTTDEFSEFCYAEEVACMYSSDSSGICYDVPDSFLGYDAEYRFMADYLTMDEFEGSTYTLDYLQVRVFFESQEEYDTGVKEIKEHITSKLGAKLKDNIYVLELEDGCQIEFDINLYEEEVVVFGKIREISE